MSWWNFFKLLIHCWFLALNKKSQMIRGGFYLLLTDLFLSDRSLLSRKWKGTSLSFSLFLFSLSLIVLICQPCLCLLFLLLSFSFCPMSPYLSSLSPSVVTCLHSPCTPRSLHFTFPAYWHQWKVATEGQHEVKTGKPFIFYRLLDSQWYAGKSAFKQSCVRPDKQIITR